MKNLVVSVTILLGLASGARADDAKVPVTAASNEALQLYLKGRDLLEKLRGTDARKLFDQAIAKDKSFAMAYVGLANTAGTTKEFFDAVDHAVAAAGTASAPEQLLIRGLDAG